MTNDQGIFEPEWVFITRAFVFDREDMRGVANVFPDFTLIADESTRWTVEAQFAALPDSALTREVFDPLITDGLDSIQLTDHDIRELRRTVRAMVGDRDELARIASVLERAEPIADTYDFVWMTLPIRFDDWVEDIGEGHQLGS